jgi:hypothetical protein
MSQDPSDRDEALGFTVSSVWRQERVSCPHPDVLRAWMTGSLEAGATEFLDFHLKESRCPYCAAAVEEMGERDAVAARPRVEDLRERLLRSTIAAIRAQRR